MVQARPEEAKRYGVSVINRALAGIAGPTVVHRASAGWTRAVAILPG